MSGPRRPARTRAGHSPAHARHGFRRCGDPAAWCDMRRSIWVSIFPRDFFHHIAPTAGLLLTPDKPAPGRTHDIAEPMRPLSVFAWPGQRGETRGKREDGSLEDMIDTVARWHLVKAMPRRRQTVVWDTRGCEATKPMPTLIRPKKRPLRGEARPGS